MGKEDTHKCREKYGGVQPTRRQEIVPGSDRLKEDNKPSRTCSPKIQRKGALGRGVFKVWKESKK